ncbi:MAG: hypothetical protein AAB414_01815 [Patescibacteria group bacterium]
MEPTPQERPESLALKAARELVDLMDKKVIAKYSAEDAQNIDQQTARLDALLYAGIELDYLARSSMTATTEEAEFNMSTIDKINQAFSDTAHDDWATLKSYVEDMAGLGESDAERDQTRGQAFTTWASLI